MGVNLLSGRRSAAAATLLLAALIASCGQPINSVTVRPRGFEWPTVQGNQQRAGYADQVVTESPEVVWETSLGRGFRTEPLVYDGVVVVAGSNRVVAAADAETGERYWEERLNAGIRGGLVWREDTLWTVTESLDGEAAALRLARGSKAWERGVGAVPYAPLLADDRLFLATEPGRVLSVHTADGTIDWRATVPAGITATPVLHEGELVVASKADTLYALEVEGGRIARKAPLHASVSAPPAVAGDLLVLPTQAGELVAVRLPELELAWRTSLGAPVLAAPVVSADGAIHALSSQGEVWRVPPGGRSAQRLATLGGAARASLTLARDRLIVGLLDGRLFLLGLDGSTVWELDLEDSIAAPVALAQGAIYVPLLRGALAKVQ